MGKVLVNTSCIESAYLTREKSTEYLFMPEVKKNLFLAEKRKYYTKQGTGNMESIGMASLIFMKLFLMSIQKKMVG